MKRKVQSQSESKEKKASDINKNDPKEINTSDIHKNECSTPQNMKSRIYNYIGSITHAQSFLQDNKFIKNGYRINFHSPKQIFKRFAFFKKNKELKILI